MVPMYRVSAPGGRNGDVWNENFVEPVAPVVHVCIQNAPRSNGRHGIGQARVQIVLEGGPEQSLVVNASNGAVLLLFSWTAHFRAHVFGENTWIAGSLVIQ